MSQIYVIKCNGKDKAYFDDGHLAIQALDIIKKSIKSRIVHIIKDTDMCFSFYFGWEEITIDYRIDTIDVISDISDFKF